MQQGHHSSRNSSSGFNGTLAGKLAAPAVSRVTSRRDPESDDRVRMIRVMMQAVDKMMTRMGIVPTELAPQA
ncbi:MAG: hypothetical protein FJZ00_01705 [Candidatus Sericytochromatia bacterium]|uniref:Uncharacterized protein n=1 Tax=Candidatus Tanganyikabacteria bacterium TaxID=2961651 RepID=A0A937X427_9BACT|nr:hypothetical protein [Candidatus Tanganyikabacteria bacterium]